MSTFIVLAALMAAAAIAIVAWPIFRSRKGEGGGATGTAVVIALAIPLGAFLLYQQWSNWPWDPAAQQAQSSQTHEMDAAIAALEARLAANGDDPEGWMLLGRSHLVTNQFAKAADAYKRAYELTGGKNAEAMLGYAEALLMADETSMGGEAGRLFEAALQLEPQNPKALWYAGLRAIRNNDAATARDRWAALSAQNPPPEVKAILDERIADLDRQLGRPVQAAVTPAAGGAAAPAGDGSTTAAPAAGASATPGSVPVRVSLAPALAGQIPPGTPLFVIARDPTNPGPPLAAKRLANVTFPLDVVLTDADAMAEGRTVSAAKQLTIVARFSKSGMPMASSGDLYGEVRYDPATGKPVELTIDKTVP